MTIGFDYSGKKDFSHHNSYSEKINKWVGVYTDSGIFEGKLEKITGSKFTLNPKLSIETNDQGWEEYKIMNTRFEYSLHHVVGMEEKSRSSAEAFCEMKNLITQTEFYRGLSEAGLVEETYEDPNQLKLDLFPEDNE